MVAGHGPGNDSRLLYPFAGGLRAASKCRDVFGSAELAILEFWSDQLMTWTEKLRLKVMAEEEIFFAQRDRELNEATHRRKSPKQCLSDKEAKEKPPERRLDPAGAEVGR